jgi:hypothetical protein
MGSWPNGRRRARAALATPEHCWLRLDSIVGSPRLARAFPLRTAIGVVGYTVQPSSAGARLGEDTSTGRIPAESGRQPQRRPRLRRLRTERPMLARRGSATIVDGGIMVVFEAAGLTGCRARPAPRGRDPATGTTTSEPEAMATPADLAISMLRQAASATSRIRATFSGARPMRSGKAARISIVWSVALWGLYQLRCHPGARTAGVRSALVSTARPSYAAT